MIPVEDVRFCPYERETVPVDHDCIGGGPTCPTEAGEPCGICVTCLSEQMGHYDHPIEGDPT